jgi:hypothetical protein
MTRGSTITMSAAILLIVCSACAGGREPTTAGGSAAREQAAPAATSTQRAVELTSDKLNAYERGLKKEIEAVRAAQQRARAAKTAEERGAAGQGAFEHATIPQGADAAGLPVEQYRELREVVNGVFQTLDFQDKIDGPMSVDLTRADEATKARVARDAFADLPPESAAALRAQMDRLVPVWIEYINLTAVGG